MLDSTIHYCAKVDSVIHLFNIWVLFLESPDNLWAL